MNSRRLMVTPRLSGTANRAPSGNDITERSESGNRYCATRL
jgi:hypothetical protein